MAMELPASPKVYTTTYDNFKGVDFTNDQTNIWRRRSPTGVNMLPDASGRPFKRHGWEIMLSNSDLCTALSVDSCEIYKCAYFELAGKDHLVIFTDNGVIFYNGEDTGAGMTLEGVTAINTEPVFCLSYDRCFFFEGNGVSAFYVYGNFRVWRYSYENGFVLEEVTDELTIPTVLFSASADGTGTLLNGYNLLGNLARVEYNDSNSYTLFAYWGSDDLFFTVKDDFKTGKTVGSPSLYQWKCTDPDSNPPTWATVKGGVSFDATNILPISPKLNDEIAIVYTTGVMLPNNIDPTTQASKVHVFGSTTTQFDTEFNATASSPSTGEYVLHDDTVSRTRKQAWIEFNASQTFADLGEMDNLRVQFPSTEISESTVTADSTLSEITGTIAFNGEAV